MPNTTQSASIQPSPSTQSNSPVRHRCRHIHPDGRRCVNSCLRGLSFCYYHYTARPAPPRPPSHQTYVPPDAAFLLPTLDDRLSIQLAISEIARRIAANQIDQVRARGLIYTLAVASSNLARGPRVVHVAAAQPTLQPNPLNDLVEDIELDPELGLIAPIAPAPPPEALAEAPLAARPKGPAESLWDEVSTWHFPAGPARYPNGELIDPYATEPEPTPQPTPATLPKLQASTETRPPTKARVPHPSRHHRDGWAARSRAATFALAVACSFACHPERVIKLLYPIGLIADNLAIFGCVETVQANCVNFSQFGCSRSLGREEPGCVAPFFRSQNNNAQSSHVHSPYAMSVPVHTANDK